MVVVVTARINCHHQRRRHDHGADPNKLTRIEHCHCNLKTLFCNFWGFGYDFISRFLLSLCIVRCGAVVVSSLLSTFLVSCCFFLLFFFWFVSCYCFYYLLRFFFLFLIPAHAIIVSTQKFVLLGACFHLNLAESGCFH